jgi:uncharacterized protein with HEPN domain
MKNDTPYLRHIQECIRRIEENTVAGRAAFLASHTLQDAVLRNLQTMSEATQRLSDDAKASHTDVEWERIAAFRNVLVHNYLGVDMERVWGVVRAEVPALKLVIAEMLSASHSS